MKGLFRELFNIPDDADMGYFVEIGMSCPDKFKEKLNNFL